jgi:hypothetical protein
LMIASSRGRLEVVKYLESIIKKID